MEHHYVYMLIAIIEEGSMVDAGGPVVAPTQGEARLLVSSDDDELVEYQQSREVVVLALLFLVEPARS